MNNPSSPLLPEYNRDELVDIVNTMRTISQELKNTADILDRLQSTVLCPCRDFENMKAERDAAVAWVRKVDRCCFQDLKHEPVRKLVDGERLNSKPRSGLLSLTGFKKWGADE